MRSSAEDVSQTFVSDKMIPVNSGPRDDMTSISIDQRIRTNGRSIVLKSNAPVTTLVNRQRSQSMSIQERMGYESSPVTVAECRAYIIEQGHNTCSIDME